MTDPRLTEAEAEHICTYQYGDGSRCKETSVERHKGLDHVIQQPKAFADRALTAEEISLINSLPIGIRNYIHNLVAMQASDAVQWNFALERKVREYEVYIEASRAASQPPASVQEAAMPPECWLARKVFDTRGWSNLGGWQYWHSGQWRPIPIAPYSDAEASVIEDWVIAANYAASVYPVGWHDNDKVEYHISGDGLTFTAIGEGDTRKAALAAAVAKLREGA